MKKPKILLLSDDLRTHSGVARVSFDLVTSTLDRFDWVQIGALIKHPEKGMRIDVSQQLKETVKSKSESSVIIYPYDSYGDPGIVNHLIEIEKPDAIMHFTDPRQFVWLYQMEHEIRQKIPICYYHVWDNYPKCDYNKAFYESCDNIMCISKLTYDIVNDVVSDNIKKQMNISYIPHGINDEYFHKIVEQDRLSEFKDKFSIGQFDFVALSNNRNISRKNMPDIINAFASFVDTLTSEQADKCLMLFKTDAYDQNGTNLFAVRDVIQETTKNKVNMKVISNKLSIAEMNLLYNISDVTLNVAGQEGWGLSSTESIMSETMIINNITGGLQDQCYFTDENDTWISNINNKQLNPTNHGEWCIPIQPDVRTIIGSQVTPYVFDDIIHYSKITTALREMYDIPNVEREKRGKAGRKFAIDNGLTVKQMSNDIASSIEHTIKTWSPKERFKLITI